MGNDKRVLTYSAMYKDGTWSKYFIRSRLVCHVLFLMWSICAWIGLNAVLDMLPERRRKRFIAERAWLMTSFSNEKKQIIVIIRNQQVVFLMCNTLEE